MNKKVIALIGAGLLTLALTAVPAFASRGGRRHHEEGNKNITEITATATADADTGENHEDVTANISMAHDVEVELEDADRTIRTGEAVASSLAKVEDVEDLLCPCQPKCDRGCKDRGRHSDPVTNVTKVTATSDAGAYTGYNTANVNLGISKAHDVEFEMEGDTKIVTGDATATSNAWVLVD